jgi:hypothetical protein
MQFPSVLNKIKEAYHSLKCLQVSLTLHSNSIALWLEDSAALQRAQVDGDKRASVPEGASDRGDQKHEGFFLRPYAWSQVKVLLSCQ